MRYILKPNLQVSHRILTELIAPRRVQSKGNKSSLTTNGTPCLAAIQSVQQWSHYAQRNQS